MTLRLYRAASWIAGVLPPRPTAWLLGQIAPLLARIAPARHAVRANLSHLVPPDQLGTAVTGVFRTALLNYYDFFRMPSRSPADIERWTAVENLEALLHAARQGRGVVCTFGHLGGFDAALLRVPVRELDCAIMVEPLQPPALFDWVSGIRSRHGLRLIPATPQGLRDAIALLRRGGVLGLAVDRDIQGHGEPFLLLGVPARLPTGAATLAVRTGALVCPITTVRRGLQVTGIVGDPFEPESGPDRESAVRATQRRILDALEAQLRRTPDQWVVFSRVWDG